VLCPTTIPVVPVRFYHYSLLRLAHRAVLIKLLINHPFIIQSSWPLMNSHEAPGPGKVGHGYSQCLLTRERRLQVKRPILMSFSEGLVVAGPCVAGHLPLRCKAFHTSTCTRRRHGDRFGCIHHNRARPIRLLLLDQATRPIAPVLAALESVSPSVERDNDRASAAWCTQAIHRRHAAAQAVLHRRRTRTR